MTARGEDILHRLEREDRERSASLRKMLIDIGRDDVLAQYDADMRDLRLGITGAKSIWHSISEAQRRVLIYAGHGLRLQRSHRPNTFDAIGPGLEVVNVARLPTLRNLSSRELIHPRAIRTGAFRKRRNLRMYLQHSP